MRLKGVAVLIGILLLGFILRYHEHLVWPREGSTFDEYAWTWLGMNIIQKHIPISWSPHPQYKIRTHYVSPKGTPFWLVQPYLEHPPLFGLVAGSYAIMNGATDMYHLDIIHIRGLAILLGVLGIFCVYLLTDSLYGRKVALLAALLYASIPTVVIGSRIVQNENFFIPGFLFMLYSIYQFIQGKGKRFFFWSVVTGGMLTLAKVPWWAASVSCILILLHFRKYKEAALFFLIVSLFFSLFFFWGYYWDAEVFAGLWKLQLNRYDITFDGILSLFTVPMLVDRTYLDGWILIGWFSFFMLFNDMKKHIVTTSGLLGYFSIYILGIPNEPGHGWYRYPFYPFLIISLSYIFIDAVKKKSLFPFFSIALIGTSLLQHTWQIAFGFSYGVYRMFILSSGLTGLSTFIDGKWSRRISTISIYSLFSLLLLLNIWAVWIYNEQ